MYGFKVFLLLAILASAVSFLRAQDLSKEDIETTITTEKSNTDDSNEHPVILSTENPDTSNINNNHSADTGVSKPPFGINNWSPNIFQNFLNHFIKTTGKTYGPNIITIIGDKPYISMEIFQKFSIFRWLMNAFQGKIQNLCGFLAPPVQTAPLGDPHVILEQLMQQGQRQSFVGSRQPTLNSGSLSVYDIAALYKNYKKTN